MTRQFGLTTRAASGGQPATGPRTGADSTRANLILFPTCPPFELREISEPSPYVFEPGSYLLFFLVLLGPALCVFGAVFFYLLMVT